MALPVSSAAAALGLALASLARGGLALSFQSSRGEGPLEEDWAWQDLNADVPAASSLVSWAESAQPAAEPGPVELPAHSAGAQPAPAQPAPPARGDNLTQIFARAASPQPAPAQRGGPAGPRNLTEMLARAAGQWGLAAAAAPADAASATPYVQAPSVQEIVEANRISGCVTMASPLAVSNMVHTVAPEGTPCVFRADAWDEAKHCMGYADGQRGQYGWCWTNLARTEWGSCSAACPLAGDAYSLGEKLENLEQLVDQLAQAVGV
uniref:ShKT domain-containing protein n=1 Tax=Pyrodinium bahamense TaxID=73915 RepID=A0A7R9ZX37_9DINO